MRNEAQGAGISACLRRFFCSWRWWALCIILLFLPVALMFAFFFRSTGIDHDPADPVPPPSTTPPLKTPPSDPSLPVDGFFPPPPSSFLDNEEYYQPMLTDGDREKIFLPELRKASLYIEFGMGGTTYVANLLPNLKKVYTIEGDSKFASDVVDTHPSLSWSLDSGRWNLLVPKYGPIKKFSKPVGTSARNLWPNYPESLMKIPAEDLATADLVLIDGRFRVACAMKVLMETDVQIILVDDFLKQKDAYGPVKRYFDLVVAGDKLAMFRRKKSIDMNAVRKLYNKMKYEPQ